MDQRAVLDAVLLWARAEDNIRAVVLTGSFARRDATVDAFSDLDIELYVSVPEALLQNTGWYRQFGEVLVVEALENPGWHPTRLVYYVDGKIDFMIAPSAGLADGVGYDRPFQVLVDKDDMAPAFHELQDGAPQAPDREEFLRCVNWFYAAVLMWAKCLVRADPWAAKLRDWDSKAELLTMLEWDHRARKGWEYDTWYNGRHLHAWVDPDLVERVEACWAGFAAEDSIRAVRESVALFDMLSRRTARALGMEPFDAARVRYEVERLLGMATS